MENQKNIDSKILNLMMLNPHLYYVQGYTNIYCEKNKNLNNNINNNNEENKIYNFVLLSNQINNNADNNMNSITKNLLNNNMKFVNMQNLVNPDNKNNEINMVPGGLDPFQNNKNNNSDSNFSKYYEGEKENNSEIIPEQFKENNENNQNNTNMINNNNIINIIKSNVINIDNDGNNNNNISNEESKNNCDDSVNNIINNNSPNNENNQNSINNNNQNNNNIINENNIKNEEKNNFKIQSQFIKDAYNSLMNDSDDDELIPEEHKKIDITFIIKDDKPFKISLDIDTKISEFLSTFRIKENQEMIPIHSYKIMNKEKTYRENHVKNEDEILLFISNLKLEEDLKEIIDLFLAEYKEINFNKYKNNLKNAIKDKAKIPKFRKKYDGFDLLKYLIDRTKISDEKCGINILEHPHKLVCCLTNYFWKCNICNKDYDYQEEKFCCSLCDFNMCHACRKLRNYERRKAIKKDITPENENYRFKYLETYLHEHKLIYCITSRFYFDETSWECDECNKVGKNWNFYCTSCNYDLCYNCGVKNNELKK